MVPLGKNQLGPHEVTPATQRGHQPGGSGGAKGFLMFSSCWPWCSHAVLVPSLQTLQPRHLLARSLHLRQLHIPKRTTQTKPSMQNSTQWFKQERKTKQKKTNKKKPQRKKILLVYKSYCPGPTMPILYALPIPRNRASPKSTQAPSLALQHPGKAQVPKHQLQNPYRSWIRDRSGCHC